jgi:hypothetical protein
MSVSFSPSLSKKLRLDFELGFLFFLIKGLAEQCFGGTVSQKIKHDPQDAA